MRINNNLNAINTHRQLGISSLNGAKSMEKLSSGFRINKAGDDAAGLAISEKMRGQIRGLNMASKNSSDTISLIQTAEGALSETHAILQRMRELSVQSANDTNTDTDRRELQAEITQLKAEIDRIGNTTEFNTKKLLEGSAKGVSEEITGSARINNNSGINIAADKMGDLMKSVANDRNWAFDGAYMLIKTNQTYNSNGAAEYRSSDFKIVGPDGTMYDFTSIAQDTSIQVSSLKAGTIVADGGVVENVKDKMEAKFTATPSTGVTVGLTEQNMKLMRNAVIGTNADTVVAAGSTLAEGSTFSLAGSGAITINGITITHSGTSNQFAFSGGVAGTDYVLSNMTDGAAATPNTNGSVSITIGDVTLALTTANTFTVTKGTVTLANAITVEDGASANNVLTMTAAKGSTIAEGSRFGTAQELYYEDATVTLGNVTLGANVDNTQMNLIKNNSVLAQGTKMTLVSGGSLNVGVTTKEIDDNVPAGATLTLAEAATSAQVSDVKQGSILAEGSTINMANNYAVELNGISITKTNHGAANATITFGAASGLDPILLASLDDKGKDVRIGNTMINVSRDGVITLKGGSAEVSAAAGLATTTVTGGFTAAAGSVLAGGSVIDTSVTAREDWTINYNAGVMTMSDNLNNNNVEIAVGATLTLDNGTVIRNNGGGEFELLSGSLITGNDLELGTDVSAFNIAAQSTIAGGSMSGLDTVTLVHSSNYRIADAGTLSNNVTIGNGVNMSNSDVTHLTAGTVLSVGSDISVADGRFIMLEVAGKEVQVSWDAANSTLKVGDEVVAAGKSITLEDGSIITNQGKFASQTQGEGMISVTSGSIKLARDISTDIGNVTGYNIAKDSTLAAGSSVAAGVSFNAGTVITAGGSTPFSGSITLAHEGKGVQFSANTSNSLSTNIFEAKTGESLTFVFTQYEAASSKLADSLMSQIGANSGQTSFLSMGDMRAKALGVDRIDISSKFGAATAIETVNNALQKVSHQRSLLGAVQNRLEHTIKNLDTAAENLQSAESRIRDVDMAREIMEHTKNNILQQASQAMLAQANQQPQSVLQLLR